MAPCCSLNYAKHTTCPIDRVSPEISTITRNLVSSFRENEEFCIFLSLMTWPGFYWLSWGYASTGRHRVRAFIIDQENVVCDVSMVLQQFEVGQLKGDAMEMMLKPSRLYVPIWLVNNLACRDEIVGVLELILFTNLILILIYWRIPEHFYDTLYKQT